MLWKTDLKQDFPYVHVYSHWWKMFLPVLCPLSFLNTARLLSLAALPFHVVHLFCKNTSISCLSICKNHSITAHWDSGWPYHDRLTIWLRRCEQAEMQREALITVWPLHSPFIFNFTRVLWTLKGDSAPRLQLISDPFLWNKGLYWLCRFFFSFFLNLKSQMKE